MGEVYCHRAQQADDAREPAANRKPVYIYIYIYLCDKRVWCSAANRKPVYIIYVIKICGVQQQIENLCVYIYIYIYIYIYFM